MATARRAFARWPPADVHCPRRPRGLQVFPKVRAAGAGPAIAESGSMRPHLLVLPALVWPAGAWAAGAWTASSGPTAVQTVVAGPASPLVRLLGNYRIEYAEVDGRGKVTFVPRSGPPSGTVTLDEQGRVLNADASGAMARQLLALVGPEGTHQLRLSGKGNRRTARFVRRVHSPEGLSSPSTGRAPAATAPRLRPRRTWQRHRPAWGRFAAAAGARPAAPGRTAAHPRWLPPRDPGSSKAALTLHTGGS
jgi:hypothetical protein